MNIYSKKYVAEVKKYVIMIMYENHGGYYHDWI